ncbi:hypothetical protein [Mycolicibacterium sp. XJ870]
MAEPSTTPSFPAPGSAVPGAPPPLKRRLTVADGVAGPMAEPTGANAADAPGAGSATMGRPPVRDRSRFTAAAAMIGVAVGLELAGLLSRRLATSQRPRTLT